MKRFAHVTVALVILLVGLVAISLGLNAGEGVKKIRIIYTNDTLGNLEPCG